MYNNGHTVVELTDDGRFAINGAVTYTPAQGYAHAHPLTHGKLLMLKSANSIFDDENYPEQGTPENAYFGYVSWDYPDGPWDADRHTEEFIQALPIYKRHGFNTVSASLMANVPTGSPGDRPWVCCAYQEDGGLKEGFKTRLRRVLAATDRWGLILFLVLFTPHNDDALPLYESQADNDALIKRCVASVSDFLLACDHQNVLIEVVHEPDNAYQHSILRTERVAELIHFTRQVSQHRFLLTAGFWDPSNDLSDVIQAVDFLSHGEQNAPPVEVAADSDRFLAQCGDKPLFCQEVSSPFCIEVALKRNCGVALYNQGINDYVEGLQSIPINWQVNTIVKWNFMQQAAWLTGSPQPPARPQDLADAPPCRVRGLQESQLVRDVTDVKLSLVAPESYAPGSAFRINRVEHLIDGRMAASVGYRRPKDPVTPEMFQLDGALLCHGPFGFDFRRLAGGEHELLVIPNYRKPFVAERSGKTAIVRFRTPG